VALQSDSGKKTGKGLKGTNEPWGQERRHYQQKKKGVEGRSERKDPGPVQRYLGENDWGKAKKLLWRGGRRQGKTKGGQTSWPYQSDDTAYEGRKKESLTKKEKETFSKGGHDRKKKRRGFWRKLHSFSGGAVQGGPSAEPRRNFPHRPGEMAWGMGGGLLMKERKQTSRMRAQEGHSVVKKGQ